MDADEVVQETIMTICREYRSLEISISISAWAYKVLDNRILTHMQTQQVRNRRTAADPAALDTIPAASPHLELRRRLIDCLRKICLTNRRYARVLNLHSQGYETEEICRRLDLKENTLYSLLRRSRMMLRRCLETGATD
jgi:RNA polymerase sigma factor (sigma-70 family)